MTPNTLPSTKQDTSISVLNESKTVSAVPQILRPHFCLRTQLWRHTKAHFKQGKKHFFSFFGFRAPRNRVTSGKKELNHSYNVNMSGLIPLLSRTQNNLQPRGQNVAKPEHSTELLLLSWSKDLKLRELKGERLLLRTGRGIKTCTFLNFWAHVEAKATEAGRGRRRACPASIMESLWLSDDSLPVIKAGRARRFSGSLV